MIWISKHIAMLPLHDWQFWLVSALALAGLWLVAKPFLPKRKQGDGEGGCPTCLSGSASARQSKRRVALTVNRRRI